MTFSLFFAMNGFLAEDVILEDQAQGQVFRGRAAVTAVLYAFSQGFPNARLEIRSQAQNGTAVFVELVFQGQQHGRFLGIPATGRQVTVAMVIVCQLYQERICRIALFYDAGTLLRQLGLAL